MPVLLQTPLTIHTGNGVTTLFAFNFKVLRASSVRVRVGGVLQTLNVGFTVAGVGENTGSITLATAPAGGVEVRISRVTQLQRERDYQTNGDLQADTIDLDFDDLWLAMQELFLGLAGGGTGGGEGGLPSVIGQDGRFLTNDGIEAFWGPVGIRYRNPLFLPDNVEHDLETLLEGGAVSLWEFLTEAQIASVVARNGVFDLTDEINAALVAARGRTLVCPPGLYAHSGTIEHDPLYALRLIGAGYSSDNDTEGTVFRHTNPAVNGWEFVYAYAQWAPGGGADAHTAFDIANAIPQKGNSDNFVLIEGIKITGPGAGLTAGSQSIQMFGPGPETQLTGNGVFLYWANNVEFRDVWVSGFPGVGYKGYWCFGSRVTRGYCVSNGSGGGAFYNANNLFVLDNVKVIGNGMKSGPFISFGWLFGTEGPSKPVNRGVQVNNSSDFEGQGYGALPGYAFEHSKGQITGITVSGGVATATLVGTINFQVGHYIGVVGGNGTNSTTAINTVLPAIILTKVGQAITWATSAPNGTYTTGIKIFPYVVGLGLQDTYSVDVKAYTESTSGPAVYVYRGCRGVDIHNGEYIDAPVYVDAVYYGSQFIPTAPGNSYTVGDTVTAVGGVLAPGGTPLRFTVTSVGGGGNITGRTLVNPGEYHTIPSETINFTGGTGSGFQLRANWYCDYPEGTTVRNNAFLGAQSGLYSQTDQIAIANNAYNRAGPDLPMFYVGSLLKLLVPNLREGDILQAQGSSIPNHGIDQTISNRTPAHYTNWFSGIGGGLNLESQATLNAARGNTGFGSLAGQTLTTGRENTFFGNNAGAGLTTGLRNVVVGWQGTTPLMPAAVVNYVGIGHNVQGAAVSNSVFVGNGLMTAAFAPVPWTFVSDAALKFDVETLPSTMGLDFLLALRPVSYYRANTGGQFRNGLMTSDTLDALDPEDLPRRELGFIAQEIEAEQPDEYDIVSDVVLERDELGAPTNTKKVMRATDLLASLVLAVQQLAAANDELQARVDLLETAAADFDSRIAALEA